MHTQKIIQITLFLLFIIPAGVFAQDDDEDLEKLLIEEKKLINPVYKPVIGVGQGTLTFFGDVQDNYRDPLIGRLATNIDVTIKIDDNFNFSFMSIYGFLSGNTRSLIHEENLNFQTEVLTIGGKIQYDFGHFLNPERKLTPFISFGVENFSFNSKGDLFDADGNKYWYWDDGTIRDVKQLPGNEQYSNIINRDFTYETDLRNMDNDGLGKYSQSAIGLPVSIGFHFTLSDKLSFEMGNAFHFTLTDNIDDISSAGEGPRKGNKAYDHFSYTYVSLHLDLFSRTKETIEHQFAVLDFGGLDFEDEDYDYIMDFIDKCPGTPRGVLVDTTGCPFDDDDDGVPNYRDKEENTPSDAFFINEDGVALDESHFKSIFEDTTAVSHDLVYDTYPSMADGPRGFRTYHIRIPENLQQFDTNNDSSISIDELYRAIDKFFDPETELSLEDIYLLKDIFFEQ